jgi:hypothetical protein
MILSGNFFNGQAKNVAGQFRLNGATMGIAAAHQPLPFSPEAKV